MRNAERGIRNEAPSPRFCCRIRNSEFRIMKIRVTCPACHDTLEVDAEHVGREVECGSCLQPFTVEDPAKKKYINVWFDSMSTAPMIMEGTYDKDNKVLTTTGEGPVLTHDEKADIVRAVVETAHGKALVFPGTGTYNTRESIEQTKMAKELGADGALMVTPYYNKPTQEGLYRHFEAVAKAVNLPIMLYNVPPRTGVLLACAGFWVYVFGIAGGKVPGFGR